MIRSLVTYGALIAIAGFMLRWLEYRHAVRFFATELYIVVIAVLFAALGAWAGSRITARRKTPAATADEAMLQRLGISSREFDVLQLLARGLSNQEIADQLFVSPNTVKTHLKNLYDKLDVSRRTQAVHKAKALRLIR